MVGHHINGLNTSDHIGLVFDIRVIHCEICVYKANNISLRAIDYGQKLRYFVVYDRMSQRRACDFAKGSASSQPRKTLQRCFGLEREIEVLYLMCLSSLSIEVCLLIIQFLNQHTSVMTMTI